MTDDRDIREGFIDPFAPIGEDGEDAAGQAVASAADTAEVFGRLDGLVERATHPPAELALDHRRLDERLASARREAGAHRRRLRRNVALYVTSGAVAAAVLLAMTLTLYWTRPQWRGPGLTLEPPGTRQAAITELGVDSQTARRIIAEGDDRTIRVVYPRRTPPLAKALAPPLTKPIVITAAPFAGTPKLSVAEDSPSESLLTTF